MCDRSMALSDKLVSLLAVAGLFFNLDTESSLSMPLDLKILYGFNLKSATSLLSFKILLSFWELIDINAISIRIVPLYEITCRFPMKK